MKPAVCLLCGKASIDEPSPNAGDWVRFADFRPLDAGALGHPTGLEYYCDEHVEAARRLDSYTAAQALETLRGQFGDSLTPAGAPQVLDKRSLWRKLMGKRG